MRTKNQSIFNAKHLLPLISGIIATIIILTFTLSHPYNRALDDAYITYRYAENFRNGMGLVYNIDEYVLGTTTPFFALLLGTLSFITNDIEFLGYCISALSWIAIAWLSIFLIPQKTLPAARITAPLLIATQAQMLPVLGMETALLTALMFAVAWAWLHNHIRLTILFAAMLLLTRQDSALWLLILGLESWRRTRQFPWREGLATTIAAAPWFTYAWLRYGSPLPNSAAAKIGQTNLMPVSGQVPFFQQFWHISTASFSTVGIMLLILLWLYFVFQQFKKEHQFLWLPAWMILYVGIYTVLNVVNFNWYFLPPTIVLNFITAVSIGYLFQRITPQLIVASQKKFTALIFSLLGLTSLVFILIIQLQQTNNLLRFRTFNETYYQVGEWLYENSLPDATVAAIEIGIIGYYSQRPVLDTMGLVSPEMSQHQLGWAETLTYALNTQQPEYAIVLANTAWDALVSQWWFQERYLPVASFERATIYQKQTPAAAYDVTTDVTFATGLVLNNAAFNAQQILPGQPLDIWLDFDVHAKQNAGYQITTFLVSSETSAWTAVTHTDPFGNTYDSKKWQIGDHLSIPIRMPVPDDLAVGAYQLGVVVYDPVQSTGLAVQDMPEKRDVRVGWLRYGSPLETAVSLPHQINAQWQNGLSIQSTSLAQSAISGEQVSLQLALKTTRPVERDLTLFVHLIDAQGSIIAQNDQRPFRGRWPTTVWRSGETWIDTFNLQLPDDTPAGSYALRIGWYDDQGQLPLLNSPDTFIILPDMISVNTVTGAAHADNGF